MHLTTKRKHRMRTFKRLRKRLRRRCLHLKRHTKPLIVQHQPQPKSCPQYYTKKQHLHHTDAERRQLQHQQRAILLAAAKKSINCCICELLSLTNITSMPPPLLDLCEEAILNFMDFFICFDMSLQQDLKRLAQHPTSAYRVKISRSEFNVLIFNRKLTQIIQIPQTLNTPEIQELFAHLSKTCMLPHTKLIKIIKILYLTVQAIAPLATSILENQEPEWPAVKFSLEEYSTTFINKILEISIALPNKTVTTAPQSQAPALKLTYC